MQQKQPPNASSPPHKIRFILGVAKYRIKVARAISTIVTQVAWLDRPRSLPAVRAEIGPRSGHGPCKFIMFLSITMHTSMPYHDDRLRRVLSSTLQIPSITFLHLAPQHGIWLCPVVLLSTAIIHHAYPTPFLLSPFKRCYLGNPPTSISFTKILAPAPLITL